MKLVFQALLLFLWSGTLAGGTELPTFRMGLPNLVIPFWKLPQTHAQRCFRGDSKPNQVDHEDNCGSVPVECGLHIANRTPDPLQHTGPDFSLLGPEVGLADPTMIPH